MSYAKKTVIVAMLASEAEGLLRAKMHEDSDTCDKVTATTGTGAATMTDGEKSACKNDGDLFYKEACSTSIKCTKSDSKMTSCTVASWQTLSTGCQDTCCVSATSPMKLTTVCTVKDMGAAKADTTALPKETSKGVKAASTCADAAKATTYSTYTANTIKYVADTCCEAKGGKSGGGCYGPCR